MRLTIITMLVLVLPLAGCVGSNDPFTFEGVIPVDGKLVYKR